MNVSLPTRVLPGADPSLLSTEDCGDIYPKSYR